MIDAANSDETTGTRPGRRWLPRLLWPLLLMCGIVLAGAGSAAAAAGDSPTDVAFAPDGSFAYVTNSGNGTVSQIATLTGGVVATINLKDEIPERVAISADGSFALVALAHSNSVARIRVSDNKVVATIPLGESKPWPSNMGLAISPDSTLAYVISQGKEVVPVRLNDNTVLSALSLGCDPLECTPAAVAFSPQGGFAYVAVTGSSNGTSRLHRVRTSDRTVQSVTTIGDSASHFVNDLAFSPDGRAFLTYNNSVIDADQTSVIDPLTGAVSPPLLGWQGRRIAFSPDGTFGHLLDSSAGVVRVVGLSDLTVRSAIPVGLVPSAVAIEPTSGAFALVTNYLSDSVTRIDLPASPTGLKATVTKTTATVTWIAPGVFGGPPISNYMYSLDNGKTWATRSPAASAATLNLTGLITGKTYPMRIRAVSANGFGVASSSFALTPAVPPAAPTALVATPGIASAMVKFAPPADNGGLAITGYEVSVDGGAWKAAAPAGAASPKIITGLTNGKSQQLRLRASNAKGPGSASSAVAVTPAGPPSAPTQVKVIPADGGVWIGFTAPASTGGAPITRYEYSLDNGIHWTNPTIGTTAAPLFISGLQNGTAQQVILRADNAVTNGLASAAASFTPSADPQPTVFVPIAPARVVDTRVASGGTGPIPPNGIRKVSVALTQPGGVQVVPPGATAVAMNVTVPKPDASGYLTLSSNNAVALPREAAITFRAGETIANGVTAKVDPGRRINVGASTSADVAIDVLGYYISAEFAGAAGTSGKFTAITPARAYTSHNDASGPLQPTTPQNPVVRRVNLSKTMQGTPILPAGVTSVAYNITVDSPTASGHLRVMPGNINSTDSSAINWTMPGDVIANGLVVIVDAQGTVNVSNYSTKPVNFLVDVVGYYSTAGARFYPMDAQRVFDTRPSQGGQGALSAGVPATASVAVTQKGGVPVVPLGAVAMSYNLTVTGPQAKGHLRVYPVSPNLAPTSVLNWPAPNYTRSNGTMVGITGQRQVNVYLGSDQGKTADAIIDVLGYYR